jgi:hypothetical protein
MQNQPLRRFPLQKSMYFHCNLIVLYQLHIHI